MQSMNESERWHGQLTSARSREAIILQRFKLLVIHGSLLNSSADILSLAFDSSSSRWDTLRVMWHVLDREASVSNPPYLPIEVSMP